MYDCNYQSSTISSLLKGFRKHDRPRLPFKAIDKNMLNKITVNISNSNDSVSKKTLLYTIFSALKHGLLRGSDPQTF